MADIALVKALRAQKDDIKSQIQSLETDEERRASADLDAYLTRSRSRVSPAPRPRERRGVSPVSPRGVPAVPPIRSRELSPVPGERRGILGVSPVPRERRGPSPRGSRERSPVPRERRGPSPRGSREVSPVRPESRRPSLRESHGRSPVPRESRLSPRGGQALGSGRRIHWDLRVASQSPPMHRGLTDFALSSRGRPRPQTEPRYHSPSSDTCWGYADRSHT
jgi:hypothetical protein